MSKSNLELPKKEELKEISQDIASSTLEGGVAFLLDNLPTLGEKVTMMFSNPDLNAFIRILTGGIVGAVAPTVFGITMTYQQKRFERNTNKALESIFKNQDIITQRLNEHDSIIRKKFIDGPYRDVLLDNIVSENQEQKVQDNINGYINLMAVKNVNDNIVFTFFNTLSQMNELDIRVLKLYQPKLGEEGESRETFLDVIATEGIDEFQYKFVQEKLSRLGMLSSKNERYRDENLDIIGNTLTELIKQLYSKKPKAVKQPNLKRVSRIESYRITPLGLQYLAFIEEPK